MLTKIDENEKIFGWWYFMADKRTVGLMKQLTEMDKILLGEESKIISKLCNSS